MSDRKATAGSPAAPASSPNIAKTDLAFAEGEALRVEDVTQILHLSRNTVYKMARDGSLPSYRVGRQIRFRYDDVRACLESFAVPGSAPAAQASVATAAPGAPAAPVPAVPPAADVLDELPAWARGSLIIGGQSLAGDVLANYLAGVGVRVLRSHANAYVSLSRMYLGGCHAAIVDLWSERERTYNTPYLRQLIPGVPAVAFRLYKHRVGLTVRARNPLGIATWSDLLAPDVRVANRERGSAPRVLLDEKLKYLEARPDAVRGYDRPVASELAAALVVARGLADVAVTSEKPFRQMKGLDFVPLQDETCDLVILNTAQTAPLIKAVRSLLRTDAFRSEFDPVLYEVRLMGELVYEC